MLSYKTHPHYVMIVGMNVVTPGGLIMN